MCQGGAGHWARKFDQVLSWMVVWVSDIFCNQSKYKKITALRVCYWLPTVSCDSLPYLQ